MRPPPELAQVAALGLIQGATELLPVSSSAHVAAVPWLLGWDVAAWPAARRKELEVALHFGALVALAPALWRARPELPALALSLAPPVALGFVCERPIEERLGGPVGVAVGLVLGAVALTAADRRGESPARGRNRGGAAQPRRALRRLRLASPDTAGSPRLSPSEALALGAAQAAALWPGVSRTGATLAAARALGHSRSEASRLSFGIAGPVLAGATALKAWRGRRDADLRLVAAGAAGAFFGTRVALRVVGLERRAALWPYAAERALLAGAILAARRRRRR